MTTEKETTPLQDETLDSVNGGDFLSIAKTVAQEVGHYGGMAIGGLGDIMTGGDNNYKKLSNYIDGLTGRK